VLERRRKVCRCSSGRREGAPAKSLRNLGWFEVIEERGLIKEGQVAEFQ